MPSHFTVKNYFDRTRELEVLGNLPAEALSGNASGIFLSGRNGIGKTELLRQAFYSCFHKQNEAVPFFYTMKTALTSIENFSRDYFSSFIMQSLAFLRKDIALIDSCVYSLEDLLHISKNSEVQWVADIVQKYEQARNEGDRLNLFLSAISAPYQSFLMSGRPVIVMLDDFHKMRKFCEINAVDNNKDFWMLFETSVKSRHTPHIFTGNQAELSKMFFEDTLFGEHLELFNLSGLAQDDAAKYFTMLSETYGLDIRIDLFDYIELFGGSLYYIRNFVQAARQSSGVLSEDNFWLIYLSEITKGKTFKYWTSLLKSYIHQLELKKLSLRFLYHLCRDKYPVVLSELPHEEAFTEEEKEQIINLLQASGVIETGFSEFEVADDRILIDIVRALYLKEIGMQPWGRIKEALIGDRQQRRTSPSDKTPSFTMTFPAAMKAELVAVKSIEYIAQNFQVPPVMTGQLQIALADLFANVISSSAADTEKYFMKYELKDNIFSAEIIVPASHIALSDTDRERVSMHLDGLNVESSAGSTKITLLKDISRSFAPAS
ncbi:MAG: ATP-binding protein [Nitrospiraceae bacterium]|nr:MAG: ATP-binding protein [Nitrospiraceae bacterium]